MKTSAMCHLEPADTHDMRYNILPQPSIIEGVGGPTYAAITIGSLSLFVNQVHYLDVASFFEAIAADMRAKVFETARSHAGAHLVTVTLEVSGDTTPPSAPALCAALDQCMKDSRAVHNSLRGNLVDHIRVNTTKI